MQKGSCVFSFERFLLTMFKGGGREGGHLWSGKKVGLSEHQVREFNTYFLKSLREIFLKCCTSPEIGPLSQWKNKTRVTSCEFQFTSYEFESTSYGFKSTSSRVQVGAIKPRVRQTVNIRVKRENSNFKILNFTRYKNVYFHCAANSELKPHTKVLKNHFHNMALKKHS